MSVDTTVTNATKDLISTADAAKVLGVSPKTLEKWRNRKLFGVPFFTADEKRGGTWYYYRERIEQLKAVYQKGVLQSMYKLARNFPSDSFQKSATSDCTEDQPKFYDSREVAKIIDIDEATLARWRELKIFQEDILTHDGIYLYAEESVEDFKMTLGKEESAQEGNVIHRPENYTTQSIFADCPVNFFLPFSFRFNTDGIKRTSKVNGEVSVCRTPVVITRRFIEPKTDFYKYEIAFRNHSGKWIKKVVDAEVLKDSKKIMQLTNWGIDFISPDAKYLAKFLNDFIHAGNNAAKIPTIEVYSQTGWNEDCTQFIYPSENEKYIVRRDGFDYESIFSQRGDKDKWIEKFKEVISKGGDIAKMVIGAALSAVVVKPLGLPNIQVHIEGKRGIGKTPLPKFSASIFGNPAPGKMSRTFSGTMKNKLSVAVAFCDLPVILDELETVSGDREEKNLSAMIYEYYCGVANQANKRDGAARETQEFSGSRISTGERPLVKQNDKAGAFKRVLNFRVKSLFEDSFAADLHKFSENNFGLFGRVWVDYVVENLDEIRKDYDELVDDLTERGILVPVPEGRGLKDCVKSEIEPTHLKALAICGVCYNHFRRKCLSISTELHDTLITVSNLAMMLPTAKEIDDTQRALNMLVSYVAGHKRFFNYETEIKTTNTVENADVPADSYETYGKIYANGEVAILTHKLKDILEKELGFASCEKLVSEWRDEGVLICKDGNRHKLTVRNNKQEWAYHFAAGVLIRDENESPFYPENITDEELQVMSEYP